MSKDPVKKAKADKKKKSKKRKPEGLPLPVDAGQSSDSDMPGSDLPYRPCVGIALFNEKGEVWIGNRIGFEGAWQLPQGGIDGDETPKDAALRELMEEIGTDKAEIIAETPEWLTYDLPAHLIGKAFGGKYRGQKQKWFAMRYLGQDEDFVIHGDHPEFDAWRWNDFLSLPDMIVPFKRPVYQQLVEIFKTVPDQIKQSEDQA
ncbi:RNA pyrophosphohydrolase [Thalassospira marina]|uniref:RNA pyrophosphohydrolase n=1 Tax=Thalassospira marina TaxID=2048283 RepID=A0A2N3KDG6_9PROT|nr:RNA pyrophosphohydrolase [Thalassospira marina]PKR48483.1 RNA pyrophosphohydrolase [Thalassospira marina]